MLKDLKKIKMHDYLSGIQQVGIGVKNAKEAMLIYKNLFIFVKKIPTSKLKNKI